MLTEHRKREAPEHARADALAQRAVEQRRRQAAVLAQLDCLDGLGFEVLEQLAELCVLRPFVPGVVIQGEGIASQHLFLVLRGTVTMSLHDRAGQRVLIGMLNRGDCFGEGPLFGDRFRGAKVQAETVCYLLQVRLGDVEELMRRSAELAGLLRATYRRRLAESTLARVPLFSQLSPMERLEILQLIEPLQVARGTAIIREGEPGEALYLIESGQVIVEQRGQAIAHLDEGDFFGEMSLLTNEPHNADIRALTPVEVLVVPAAQFQRLLLRQPALAAQLREVVERRRANRTSLRDDASRLTHYAEAVEHGLLRGTHVLLRDRQLCKPDCHLCETACATRHGHSRISISDAAIDELDITNTCRQCRVGAECVEACPENAIQWDDRGALVITDACTGCGACLPACPYDAVNLVPRDRMQSSPLGILWQRLQRATRPTIPLEPARPTRRANKCDLCHGHADLACVSACPTGALRLVPVEELFTF